MTHAANDPEPGDVRDLEARIADVWAAVLNGTVHDYERNFLDAGGTSLKMMRLHVELMRVLDRKIAITTMFEFPSISALARHLAATKADAPAPMADRQSVHAAPAMRPGGLRRRFRAYKK